MDPRIINAKLDALRRRAISRSIPISGWVARTADHLGPEQYRYDGDWLSVEGEATYAAGKTLFLRVTAEAPSPGDGHELYIHFDGEGLEGLLSINAQPYAGIDANHPRVWVTQRGSLRLEAEFICLPAALHNPALRRERARLRQVAFLWVDRALESAVYDLWLAWEASQEIRESRRRQLLADALEGALLAIDLTAEPDRFHEEVATGQRILRERIAAIVPDPEAGQLLLTGHSHIDTAWLWPLQETVRKCGRTFATACRLLERYPQFSFSCSQPQLYAYAQQYYPALYEEIKAWVQRGRWECTGGMWVEADCNVTSGESLIRQVLHGLRFFREEFGKRPRACWLPDVFGYPASLPQILKGCGLDYFYTNKLHWQARNPFPAHLFWWEGIDGTRLLAHIPRLPRYYNGWPNPQQLSKAWEDYGQKAAHPELLFPFGFGDGGGGVTEEMLEFAAREEHYPGLPATRQGLEEAYFDDVAQAAPDLPVWQGELYLETHRGTYTSQGAIKAANRRNELALREAEIWSSLAAMQGTAVAADLDGAWKNLLLLQFHDILPGSSIGWVYREAAADHAHIAARAGQVCGAALDALVARANTGGDVMVFNSLSWPRCGVAVLSLPSPSSPLEAVQPDGRALPTQVVGESGGQAELIFAAEDVPALGTMALRLRPSSAPASHSLSVSARQMENRYFLLELGEDGSITRLLDKRFGREVVPPGQPANRLQLFQDGPEREAAWNIHATYEKREYAWDPGTTVQVVETGPVRAVVQVTRHYRHSRVQQDITLYDRLPRIDFRTQVHWQERQVMLKAAFPVQVRSMRAAYEVQFGTVERPTHRNTSWEQEKFEVCAHRWADLSEAGYGVSLLNDSKYGYDVHDNVMRLTLLRGPEWPDPDADRGDHTLVYSLLPHAGDWPQGGTVHGAWELNVPLACVPIRAQGTAPLASQSFVEVEGPAVLETLKEAENGEGWILRLYEPYGSRGTVRVRMRGGWHRVVACNLVEEATEEVALAADEFAFPITPFQICTFRLYRTP